MTTSRMFKLFARMNLIVALFLIAGGQFISTTAMLSGIFYTISIPGDLEVYEAERIDNLKSCVTCALYCMDRRFPTIKCVAFGCDLENEVCDYYQEAEAEAKALLMFPATATTTEAPKLSDKSQSQYQIFQFKGTDVFHSISMRGRLYSIYLSGVKKTYADARAHCNDLGAYLYEFNSPEEYEAVGMVVNGQSLTPASYVGANDLETYGLWVTDREGIPLNQQEPEVWNWYTNEPSGSPEHCATIYYTLMMQLNDVRCNHLLTFLCKRDV